MHVAGGRLHPAHGLAIADGLLGQQRLVAGGPRHPAERDHPRRPDQAFDRLHHLGRIDPLHLVGVEEVLHRAAMLGQGEPDGVEGQPVAHRPPVEDLHLTRLIDAGVELRPRRHEPAVHTRCRGEVVDLRLDRLGLGRVYGHRRLIPNRRKRGFRTTPAAARPAGSLDRRRQNGAFPAGCHRRCHRPGTPPPRRAACR